ncbi:MAG: cytochrome c [Croceibacterium sp.]
MTKPWWPRVIAGAVLFVAVAGHAQDGEKAVPDSGQQNFLARCGGCHLEGGFGTRVLSRRVPADRAMLERRGGLPAGRTRAAVRNGIGSMPQIRAAELDDATLSSIAAYLTRAQ